MTECSQQNEPAIAGTAVAEARRAAGLDEKELARRIGVSLWELDQVESGSTDPSRYLTRLEEHIGPRHGWASLSDAVPVRSAAGEAEGTVTEEWSEAPASESPWQNRLIAGSVGALVVVRLFTEVVPVIPRLANVVDVIILPMLLLATAFAGRARLSGQVMRWLLPLGAAFLALCMFAALANPARVEIGPAFVFVYGALSPLLLYVAVYRLWQPGFARSATRFLVALGVLQLVVVTFIQLPGFLGSGANPDDISGTFGTNAYQLVFFLIVVISTLAGIYTWERASSLARFAPFLIAASFGVIVLAQYRALIPTTILTLLLITIFLARSGGRGFTTGAAALIALVAALVLGAQFFPILKLGETFEQDPVEVVTARAHVVDQLDRIYSDEPRFILTGTGPGTYSSRGFVTFNTAASTSKSNTVGPYVLKLTGGRIYRTDVSDRYLDVPNYFSGAAVAGSFAVATPFASYVAIAAEVGILGLGIMLAIYGGALVLAVTRLARAARLPSAGDPLPSLLLAAAVGLFVLMQMGLLENWLEVTRLTFLVWGLLAIANKEFDHRYEAEGR